MTYKIHDKETAPEAAKDILVNAKNIMGFVPNLYGVMASAPALLKAYTTLSSIFDETSFSAAERQVVLLTVSFENECDYCMAAHTVIAGMQKVPGDVVAALRSGDPLADPKLEALRRFTSALVTQGGWPSDEDRQSFFDAGYGETQILEVVLGIGMKTISNYTNHNADTPLDKAFEPAAWTKS